MKACIFLLLASLPVFCFAQDTLDLPLKRTVKTTKNNCRKATAADVCKTVIFTTDRDDLFYKINYDMQGRIHSKGAVVKAELETTKAKKKTEYFEVGMWRYYNYDANEIVYYRCVYSGTPGCSILTKEEMKKEKME